MNELSLRDLIEILIKRKLLILGTILSLLLLVGIYVFLVQDTYYAAEVSVNITRLRETNEEIEGNSVDEVLESISALSGINQNNLVLTLRSEEVIQKTLEELDLEDTYKVEEVAGRISFSLSEETGLATIIVRDKNSQRAANLANTIASHFVAEVQKELAEASESALNYIEKQLETEAENFQAVQDELQGFLSTPKGIEELSMELETKVEQISEYKVSVRDLQVGKNALDQAITVLEEDLSDTSQKISLTKSILEDPILSQLISQETGASLEELSEVSYREEVANELHIILSEHHTLLRAERAMTTASIESKNTAIEEIEQDLVEVRTLLNNRQAEYRAIEERLWRSQEIYDKFSAKYEEIRITGSFDMGEAIISIVSTARPPSQPTTGNRKITFAIALILGLILGVVFAFGKEYWVNTSKKRIRIDKEETRSE